MSDASGILFDVRFPLRKIQYIVDSRIRGAADATHAAAESGCGARNRAGTVLDPCVPRNNRENQQLS
jgi:hypothetical protein